MCKVKIAINSARIHYASIAAEYIYVRQILQIFQGRLHADYAHALISDHHATLPHIHKIINIAGCVISHESNPGYLIRGLSTTIPTVVDFLAGVDVEGKCVLVDYITGL